MVLGEWLITGAIYLAVAVVLVLAWLTIFAVTGTAITAGINRLIRRRPEAEESEWAADEDTETDRLKAMFSTD